LFNFGKWNAHNGGVKPVEVKQRRARFVPRESACFTRLGFNEMLGAHSIPLTFQ